MNIAVIDGSIDESRVLAGFISSYFSQAHIFQNTTLFNTAGEFWNQWQKGAFDLVFLDIFLKNEPSGFSIAKRIHQEDKNCSIIFTTSSRDYALRSYEVRALDYMVKPIRYERFFQTMEYFSALPNPHISHYIQVKESRIMVKIPIDRIFYTDYSNHYILIHLSDRLVRTYMRFCDFSQLLSGYPQFVTCCRNCIVNVDHVSSLEKWELILTSGQHLPIARNLRIQVQQKMANYQFNKESRRN